ncbi:TetR family transcriptional regulator C-terminal domain-containing protein [Halostreptopolyspora alba]
MLRTLGHSALSREKSVTTAARLRPEFRALSTRMGTDLRAVLRQALESARVPDPEVEAERLTALVSGLTFDWFLVFDPDGGVRESDPPVWGEKEWPSGYRHGRGPRTMCAVIGETGVTVAPVKHPFPRSRHERS